MTDDKIFDKYERNWDTNITWCDYIRTIPTNDLIRISRIEFVPLFKTIDIKELRLRTDIPEKYKLEVLLLIGGDDD